MLMSPLGWRVEPSIRGQIVAWAQAGGVWDVREQCGPRAACRGAGGPGAGVAERLDDGESDAGEGGPQPLGHRHGPLPFRSDLSIASPRDGQTDQREDENAETSWCMPNS